VEREKFALTRSVILNSNFETRRDVPLRACPE